MGKQWKLRNFIFWGSKITADGDCSHEIKRRLLLGRKAMTNLDSILKSRDTFSSVQFSGSVMSDPLWSHGLQHARPLGPSPTPGVYSNSCPLSRWWHQTISSSVVSFSSYLQSFPASGSFPMSQLFASGNQCIGASASASVFPMNIQDWFPLGLTVWHPCSRRDSQESFPTPQIINSSAFSLLCGPTLTAIHDYWKNHSFD